LYTCIYVQVKSLLFYQIYFVAVNIELNVISMYFLTYYEIIYTLIDFEIKLSLLTKSLIINMLMSTNLLGTIFLA